jgi:hypothetical protein
MDLSKNAGSQYLRVADLKKSGPFKAKITAVKINEKFDKPDIVLDDGTTLSLNVTSSGRLIRHYGSESDDWIGKEVELYVDEVDYKGQLQEAVLVRPISPPLDEKAPVKRKDDLDDSIPFK